MKITTRFLRDLSSVSVRSAAPPFLLLLKARSLSSQRCLRNPFVESPERLAQRVHVGAK